MEDSRPQKTTAPPSASATGPYRPEPQGRKARLLERGREAKSTGDPIPAPVQFIQFSLDANDSPRSVREHFGEQVAEDFSRWFAENVEYELVTKSEYRKILSRLDAIDERFAVIDEQFEKVDERFEHVDERFDQMEDRFNERFEQVDQRFEQVDQRLEQVDQRFESMEERFDKRFEGMDAKLDRMNDRILSMTRWLIGLVALFGSLVTALLAVAQFTG